MNKAILMGRLTKDPEVRYSQNNLAVCNYTIAVNRQFARQGEERQADFIPIVTFGKTAEFCEKYFRKGQQVAVSGRIQVRTWDDNEGKRRYVTEVIAEDCYFADSKRSDGGGGGGSDYAPRPEDYGYYPPMNQASPMQSQPQAQAQAQTQPQSQASAQFQAQPQSQSQSQSYRQPDAAEPDDGAFGSMPGTRQDQGQGQGQGDAPYMDDGFVPVENENDLPF
jgi:single-strand DNA-binding protein